MYFIYAIKSIKFGSMYVGMTSDLEKILKEHNSGRTRSNKAYRQFEIVYFEEKAFRTEARKREKYLKSAAGKKYIAKNWPRSSAE